MRFLIRRCGGHGDMLSLTSAIPGLEKKYPAIEIYFQTTPEYAQLIQHDPRIAGIFWHDQRSEIVFDINVRPSHARLWRAARAEGETLWMGEAQCKALGVEFSPPRLYLLPEELEAAGGSDVALANRYPFGARSYSYMAKLAALLVAEGYHVRQIDTCPRLHGGVDNSPLTIRQAAAEVAKTRCLVTIDSAFLHVGVALGKSMVVIFNQVQRSSPKSQFVPDCWVAGWVYEPKRIVSMVKHLLGDAPAPDEENTFDPAYRRGYE